MCIQFFSQKDSFKKVLDTSKENTLKITNEFVNFTLILLIYKF